jgi:hypothetical protein
MIRPKNFTQKRLTKNLSLIQEIICGELEVDESLILTKPAFSDNTSILNHR